MAAVAAALAGTVRASMQVDRSKIALDVAARGTIGVAIPLIGAQLLGYPVDGVTASIGALSGGFASFQGTYRSRAGAVLAASAGMALSAFVGATIGHVIGIDMAVTALWGFAAGLLVCLGPTATVSGVQSVVGLVVFSQFHLSPMAATHAAGLVLLGGLIQTLLVVVVWPLRRFPAERRALSEVYGQLATDAGQLPDRWTSLLVPGPFDDLHVVLRDPQPFGGALETAAHSALAAEAERIRLELMALARVGQELRASNEKAATGAMADVALGASGWLSQVAAALQDGRVPVGWEEERHRVEAGISALRALAGDRSAWPAARLDEAVRRSQALAGQLRAAARVAAVPAGGDPRALEAATVGGARTSAGAGRPRLVMWSSTRDQLATLRANFTLTSEACRHGVRVALALAAAVALARLIGVAHGYWLPLTVMIVLKPDFGSTYARGLSRVGGTLVGAGLVTVALAELRPGPAGLTSAVLVWCFGAYALLFANYALFSGCVASLVVTLLAFTGQPELSVAAARSIYTVVGAALALLAYAIWPTWAATYLPDRLADLVRTDAGYGRAILRAWADPAAADRASLQRARVDARLARSNAEAAADRWMSEPGGHGRLARETVLGVLAAIRSYLQGVLTLHARLPDTGVARPALNDFADDLDDAMSTVAVCLRAGGSPTSWPPLRTAQQTLAEDLGVGQTTGPPLDRQAVVLASETDVMVNAVDTIGHLIAVKPPAPGAGRPAR
jgi:uncharacterized membrane protein YccC